MDEWYRYDDFQYYDGDVRVSLTKYRVLRETPCGVWLAPAYYPFSSFKRWVKRGARRKFACPTEAEALESFIARKRRQLSILKYQIERAELALAKAKEMQGGADGQVREVSSVRGIRLGRSS